MDNERLFNRQYLIGDRDIDLPWRRFSFGPFRVSTHPNLDVTAARDGATEALILGYAFDSRSPDSGMTEISASAARAKSWDEFENASKRYCGRYIVLLKLGSEIRLYPDAVGQRSCFYGEGWIASQPGLIGRMVGLRKDKSRDYFFSFPHSLSWPGTITPYHGIRMLCPNHYLDLTTMESVRFWPKVSIAGQDVHEAAWKIVDLISTIMANAGQRYRLWLALTGGHDSRVIFTSSRNLHRDMEFFSIRDESTPATDIEIPRLLCSTYGLSFRVFDYLKPDPDWLALYDQNVCFNLWTASRKKSKTYDLFPKDVMVVKGHVPSAGRATLYKDGYRYKHITPQLLSRLLGYGRDPVASEEFGKWLEAYPSGFEDHLLEIFFQENKGGTWGSMECTGSDTNFQVFSPYNCVDIEENQLSVDKAYCIYPHRLNHIMADLTCPEIRHIPWNPKSPLQKLGEKAWLLSKRIRRL